MRLGRPEADHEKNKPRPGKERQPCQGFETEGGEKRQDIDWPARVMIVTESW